MMSSDNNNNTATESTVHKDDGGGDNGVMVASVDMPPLQRPATDALSPSRSLCIVTDNSNGDNKDSNSNNNHVNNNNNNDDDDDDSGLGVIPLERSDSQSTVATLTSSASEAVSHDSSGSSGAGGSGHHLSFRLDRWGNMVSIQDSVSPKHHQKSSATVKLERNRIRRDTQREMKWIRMMQSWESFRKNNPHKVKERIRKGIPDSLRAAVWPTLTGARDQRDSSSKLYGQLLKKSSEFEAVIGRDINRTFPRHVLFRKDENLEDDVMALEHQVKINQSQGQGALFNVCKCYSIFDSEVGYCQGMGFVAGLLLMYMSEEESFWNLERIMRGDKFRLRTLFLPGFPLLRQFFYQLTKLMEWYLPELSRHFNEQGMMPDLFATQWFLTLYARTFPTELVLRIWDVFLNEGVKIVFRVALYILRVKSKQLLKMDIGGMMPLLQNIQTDPLLSDSDTFMTGVMHVPLSRRRLESHAKEYQAQQLQDANATTKSKKDR